MRGSYYVHFPYCLEKCPYCDFVSYKIARDAIDHRAYADAILTESSVRSRPDEISSIFVGGGTPSLWEPSELKRVLSSLLETTGPAKPDSLEITVECNPTSLDREHADALAHAGVNRLSIGVQSLRNHELEFLGRLHDADGAIAAVRAALESPIERVSADLIFGLPNQSPDEAARQALALADLGLTHLSCYQLTIEPKTRFGELAKIGRLPLASDGAVAESFIAIDEALGARGFRHYEISNYAKPGQESRHNLGYWRGADYIGLGCGAYGFTRSGHGGVRWRNRILPKEYLARPHDATLEREELGATALLRERIMLGLRLEGGLDLAAAGDDLGLDPFTPERRRTIDTLVSRNRLSVDGSRLRIPRHAWLFTDDTAARLF